MEESGQFHAPAALTLGQEVLVPIGQEIRWVSEQAWDVAGKRKITCRLSGIQLQFIGRPSSNQPLYRLRHPTSLRTVALSLSTIIRRLILVDAGDDVDSPGTLSAPNFLLLVL
jgi:hypothetical protein